MKKKENYLDSSYKEQNNGISQDLFRKSYNLNDNQNSKY